MSTVLKQRVHARDPTIVVDSRFGRGSNLGSKGRHGRDNARLTVEQGSQESIIGNVGGRQRSRGNVEGVNEYTIGISQKTIKWVIVGWSGAIQTTSIDTELVEHRVVIKVQRVAGIKELNTMERCLISRGSMLIIGTAASTAASIGRAIKKVGQETIGTLKGKGIWVLTIMALNRTGIEWMGTRTIGNIRINPCRRGTHGFGRDSATGGCSRTDRVIIIRDSFN
jgi:hypothetical protein